MEKKNKIHFIYVEQYGRWWKYFGLACYKWCEPVGEYLWSSSSRNQRGLIPDTTFNTFDVSKVTCKACLRSLKYKQAAQDSYDKSCVSLFRGKL